VNISIGKPFFFLFILTLIFYLSFLARIILSPLLPGLEQDSGITVGQAGFLFLVMSCGHCLSSVGSSFFVARIGHKNGIILSMVGTGFSLFLFSFAETLPSFYLSFFLLGLSSGFYIPSAITIISTLFVPEQWGRGFAVHELAPNLAFLTAPFFAAILLPLLSWQEVVQLLGVAVLLGAALFAVLGPGFVKNNHPPDWQLCRQLISRPDFWFMTLLFSLGITGTVGVYSVLPAFLVNVHSFDEQSANLLLAMSRIPAIAAALAGGFIADRFGNKKTICWVFFATGGVTMLLGMHQEFVIFYVYMQALLAVSFFPAAFAMLSRTGPVETRSITVSFIVPLGFVFGGGIIPAFITAMATHGRFEAGIIVTGLLLVAGGVVSVLTNHK
jgi:NNP family nitrate/nitrite transporter-like MFS transporter